MGRQAYLAALWKWNKNSHDMRRNSDKNRAFCVHFARFFSEKGP
jgi:hypothetical protein